MYKPKEKKKLYLIFGLALILMMVLVASQTFGYRPPDPQAGLKTFNGGPLFVPQNLGIYDKYYCQFDEPECRVCHGANTATRHHNTLHYFIGDCLYCHTVLPGPTVEPERNCKVCHVGTTPLGGGGPHHATNLADSDQCTQCHDPSLLVETWSVPPPSGPPDTNVMPRPWTCENCHWPKINPPGLPDDIQANGPVQLCFLGGPSPQLPLAQRYLPADGTHHEVDEKVYAGKCFNCHSSTREHDPDYTCEGDPSGMYLYLIRYCENCHSRDSLHGISEHVTAGHGMTANEKCVACHGSYPTGEFVIPSAVPTILSADSIRPSNEGSSGMIVKVRGTNFGDWHTGDWIRIGTTPTPGLFDMAIHSWDDSQIEAIVPSSYGGGLPPGATYNIRVHKAPIPEVSYAGGTSNLKPFTVDMHPDLESVVPDNVVYNTNISLNSVNDNTFGTAVCDIAKGSSGPTGRNGTGTIAHVPGDDTLTDATKTWSVDQWKDYYVTVVDEYNDAGEVYPRKILSNTATALTIDGDWKQSPIPGTSKYIIADGKQMFVWGHCYWVKYESGADDYRMGCYRPFSGSVDWSPSEIKTKMAYLYDINAKTAVPQDQYYKGDWNVYVYHEYFVDDGDGWHYNIGHCANINDRPDTTKLPGYIDTGDKVIVPTDDQPLQNWYFREISDPPKTLTITGDPFINCIRPCNGPAGTVISILGSNFGISQGSAILHFGTKVFFEGNTRIKFWSNTKIRFKVPSMTKKGKNYFVYITGQNGVDSNKKRFYLTP